MATEHVQCHDGKVDIAGTGRWGPHPNLEEDCELN
jgi:hypothetical protein